MRLKLELVIIRNTQIYYKVDNWYKTVSIW